MVKDENAGYQHFHLLPKCFLSYDRQISLFVLELNVALANPLNLKQSKVLSFGEALTESFAGFKGRQNSGNLFFFFSGLNPLLHRTHFDASTTTNF